MELGKQRKKYEVIQISESVIITLMLMDLSIEESDSDNEFEDLLTEDLDKMM